MHDDTIEQRLRAALRAEADGLPLTVTPDELERRLALRRRERTSRRFGLLAAGVAAIAVGTVFAIAVGPFRGPNVAATPQLTMAPSIVGPSPAVSTGPVDPAAVLQPLEPSDGAVDFQRATEPGDPTSTDTAPETGAFDSVRMDAREAGVKLVCLGPDTLQLTWGTTDDRSAIASETVTCDNSVASFRYDVAPRQPLIDHWVWVDVPRRTSYSILVESFGFTNDPPPSELPAFGQPGGDVLLDVRVDAGVAPGGTPSTGRAGAVPARHGYRVAMVCLGTGSARWTIGAEETRDFIDGGDVPCDGAALGFSSSAGLPSKDSTVYVTADPGTSWHLIITDPYGPPMFIPPSIDMWSGEDRQGSRSSGPAECVGFNDHVNSCGVTYSARDGAPIVVVPPGSAVWFTLSDGWTLDRAYVHAVDRAMARTEPASVEVVAVGTARSNRGQTLISVADLPPGEWILRVQVDGSKGDDRFGAWYQIPLRVEG